ncbi:hypothetical protein [Priestia megaterium]|uniref:hypothetical protein n=1 Tax=Priestia megaterium TaxID=1404 RepID=UPI0031013EF7
MSLEEQVKKICNRLATHGWKDLFQEHGLNITASNLKEEFLTPLQNINRTLKGFEDFSLEGTRGIEPGQPAQSLFYHALASPNVVTGSNDCELTEFPTLAELEIIENYVYGIKPPSLYSLRSKAKDGDLAIVVFASEYRPSSETVHKKHADLCFSRTGIARVGTTEPLYHSRNRGFLPFVEEDAHSFRVLPARYSAYIAVQRKGKKDEFGPMRFRERNDTSESLEERTSDAERLFWVPLHKLFNGSECISDINDLHVELKAYHVNEKLRRIHLELGKETGWGEPHISNEPFIFTEGIAEWSNNESLGNNVLVPIPHPRLVEEGYYEEKLLTFKVPKNPNILSSSLLIPSVKNARRAPEYVHIRHKEDEDLNKSEKLMEIVKSGGYDAIHYIDFTGDGWIEASCPKLAYEFVGNHAAYSLVTAPDFFPNCDQRELLDWYEHSVPSWIKDYIWVLDPLTLSDTRKAANLTIRGSKFSPDDVTMTSIISLPYEKPIKSTSSKVSETVRHVYLPDAASGEFQPGWDVSFDRKEFGGKSVEFLATYGLGSPFPEDAKLCAALSTFWPAVAPDTARTFEPNNIWPTVSPLTDEEIGKAGGLSWDGYIGPIQVDNEHVEYTAFNYVDYVDSALNNKFSLLYTGKVDINEYKARLITMAYVYKVLGISADDVPYQDRRNALRVRRGQWSVLSFRKTSLSDEELQTAKIDANALNFGEETPSGIIYRYEVYRYGQSSSVEGKHKRRVEIKEKVVIFINGEEILIKHKDKTWEFQNVRNIRND